TGPPSISDPEQEKGTREPEHTHTGAGGPAQKSKADVARQLIDRWSKKTGRRVIVPPTDRVVALLASFTHADLEAAIDHFAASEWQMANNAHRGAAWFFDNTKRLEAYVHLDPPGDNARHREQANGH